MKNRKAETPFVSINAFETSPLSESQMKPALLITGAAGYLGSMVLSRVLEHHQDFSAIVGLDVRQPADIPLHKISNFHFEKMDIRSEQLKNIFNKYQFTIVVHLAAILNSGGPKTRDFEYSVDVGGTEKVLKNCVRSGVTKLIVSSSGAAYGYHPDNPVPLREDAPLRGNDVFAYACHKRLVEEILARYRQEYPQLKQLIFRPGTILGKHTDNDITQIFHRKVIPGVRGTDTPFVFIWDEDVVACILEGIFKDKIGIYNLAGDGTVSLREIANYLGKRFLPLPVALFRGILWLLYHLRCSKNGPDQVLFLQYRPVLANDRLKQEFGYTPQKTSLEVFKYYWQYQSGSRVDSESTGE